MGRYPTPDCPDAGAFAPQIEDAQDLANARAAAEVPGATKPWWKQLGPGLITGAADNDPAGIGAYSVAGAQFGYQILWLVPSCVPLMIAAQEMCGRIGVVTGKGLAGVIKEHLPKWVLFGAVSLLIGANVINIYADSNVMAASAKMLFHGNFGFWLTLETAVITFLLIAVPYRLYVRNLKWLCLAMLTCVVTTFMPASHNDWGEIARPAFVPSSQRSS